MSLQLVIRAALPLLLCVTFAAAQPAPTSANKRLFGRDAESYSIDELTKMFADEAYQQLIDVVDRRLASARKGPAGGEAETERSKADTERAKLLLLKGEACLRLGNAGKAAIAFNDATVSPDPVIRTEALSIALLLKRSKGMYYAPRTDVAVAAGKGPTTAPATMPSEFNVVKDRKQAMEALCRDELADANAKPASARKLGTLQQVFQFLSATRSLCAVEQVATGATTETTELLYPVAEQARSLMEGEMSGMDAEIALAKERANRTILTNYNGHIQRVKIGLRNDDRATLNSIIDTCAKMTMAADELRALLPMDRDPFTIIKGRADYLTNAATEVLNDTYQERVTASKPAN